MQTITNLKSELGQFTGTEHYYRHWLGLRYTDGVKFLAEKAGAYWLIDLVASYQPRLKNEAFQVWTLKKTDKGFMAVRDDGNDHILRRQLISYSDIPTDILPLKMCFTDNVLMLTSEY